MYGMHVQAGAPYVGVAAVGAVVGVSTSLMLRRSPAGASLMLAGWAAVGCLAAYGDLRQAVYWSLCVVYGLAAVKLHARLPARSLGKLTIMTGFIVWALCLLIHPWVVHYREYADVASHVWNMQKGLISIGLLLLLLEQQVADNRWLAQHDELTGLPNRRSFERSFEEALREGRRSKTAVALVLLDLNGFKAVNDSLGHQAGDLLLSGVAKNLSRIATETAVAARLGGDEFVVSASLTKGKESLLDVLADVRAAIDRPIACGEHLVSIKASVGFAVFPEDAGDAHELLKLADQRMYLLKGKRAASERGALAVGERPRLVMSEPWQRPVVGGSSLGGRHDRP
jgi:diguanylate cyclase (GGDEF)-like protein